MLPAMLHASSVSRQQMSLYVVKHSTSCSLRRTMGWILRSDRHLRNCLAWKEVQGIQGRKLAEPTHQSWRWHVRHS